jgi:hypothetical protein
MPTGMREHPPPGQPPMRRRRLPTCIVLVVFLKFMGFIRQTP